MAGKLQLLLRIENMGDLKRKKHALVQDLQQISKGVKKLRRQLPIGGQLQISAAQRTVARALMVMRDGEPTDPQDTDSHVFNPPRFLCP